jgi:hypothetical protein
MTSYVASRPTQAGRRSRHAPGGRTDLRLETRVRPPLANGTRLSTTARAQALFSSDLSATSSSTFAEVIAAIDRTLRTYGTSGCADRLAAEYGDHPETAVPRMRWALATAKITHPHAQFIDVAP